MQKVFKFFVVFGIFLFLAGMGSCGLSTCGLVAATASATPEEAEQLGQGMAVLVVFGTVCLVGGVLFSLMGWAARYLSED